MLYDEPFNWPKQPEPSDIPFRDGHHLQGWLHQFTFNRVKTLRPPESENYLDLQLKRIGFHPGVAFLSEIVDAVGINVFKESVVKHSNNPLDYFVAITDQAILRNIKALLHLEGLAAFHSLVQKLHLSPHEQLQEKGSISLSSPSLAKDTSVISQDLLRQNVSVLKPDRHTSILNVHTLGIGDAAEPIFANSPQTFLKIVTGADNSVHCVMQVPAADARFCPPGLSHLQHGSTLSTTLTLYSGNSLAISAHHSTFGIPFAPI